MTIDLILAVILGFGLLTVAYQEIKFCGLSSDLIVLFALGLLILLSSYLLGAYLGQIIFHVNSTCQVLFGLLCSITVTVWLIVEPSVIKTLGRHYY